MKTQEECFEPGMEMELKLIDGRIEEDCDKGKSGRVATIMDQYTIIL